MSSRPVLSLESQVRHIDDQWFDELDDETRWPGHIAFNARYFSEEIEGGALYVEKYCKEKIKTLTVALVICLNIDIDPPDVQKIPPFCRVEAWFDPTDANSLRALETIGKNLQIQYERWQPRARYRQCLDPTLDDVKKLCVSLRRNAKEDRILFHYNGHGVPRPTENGEIWVFNTKFTKYIPLSLYDLQRWLGAPSVYVFDCQNAGRVIRMYENFCQRRLTEQTMAAAAAAAQRQQQQQHQNNTEITDQTVAPNGDGTAGPHVGPLNNAGANGGGETNRSTQNQQQPLPGMHAQASVPQLGAPLVTMENTIMLAACREDEDLPQNPELPADLFTACLTTPIRMALRWHWLRHQEHFPGYLDEALLDRIPGSHSNRMSLLGEVNWIFTAVTDTIAWCSFPIDIFQKLFRQDLLVASLFRNFLLAERIMKTYGCTPVSAPALLPTFRHPMWSAWDHALDRVVHYLPRMLKIIEGSPLSERKLPIVAPGNGFYPLHSQNSTTNATHPTNTEQQQPPVAGVVVQRSNQNNHQPHAIPGPAPNGASTLRAMPAADGRTTNAHLQHGVAIVNHPSQQMYAQPAVAARLHPTGYEKPQIASNGTGPSLQPVSRDPCTRPPAIPQIPVRPVTTQPSVGGGRKPQADANLTTGLVTGVPPGFIVQQQQPPPPQQQQTDFTGVRSRAANDMFGRRVTKPPTAELDPNSRQVPAPVGPGRSEPHAGGARHTVEPVDVRTIDHLDRAPPGQPNTTDLSDPIVKSKVSSDQSAAKGDAAPPSNDPSPKPATKKKDSMKSTDPNEPSGSHDNVRSAPKQSSTEATKDAVKMASSEDDDDDEDSEDDDDDETDDDDDEIDESDDDDEDDDEDAEDAATADEASKTATKADQNAAAAPANPSDRATNSLERLRRSGERPAATAGQPEGVTNKPVSNVGQSRPRMPKHGGSCPNLIFDPPPARRRESSKNKHGTRLKASSGKTPQPPTTCSDLAVTDKQTSKDISDEKNNKEMVVSDVSAPQIDTIKQTETVVATMLPSVGAEQHNADTGQKFGQLRRQQHGLEQLYALQGQTDVQTIVPTKIPVTNIVPATDRPICPPRPQSKATGAEQAPVTWITGSTQVAPEPPAVAVAPPTTTLATAAPIQQTTQATQSGTTTNTVSTTATSVSSASANAGSVIGGSGPASFFTSQMTAFKVWLQTADEKQPPATQLPILLQILLSQSHRIRAMQLLSEFLDLGPWAVTHCLTVGILPYIVRLFHSPVAEVKPHLVFIWGKIIATAQTEFGRNDSVRDFGYKYFIACLNDTDNLTPLTRTITAFALAKMLEKEPHGEADTFFQDVYLKQNFIPLVLSQLYENPPDWDVEIHVRLRLWLIFALAKVWRNNDEARWYGVRYNVTEVLFTYLDDISPEVRAATVYALGTLIANQTTDASKQDHADQFSHQVGARLVKVAYLDASWLVRCELVVAFAGLARQFEVQLCAMALYNLQEFRDTHNPVSPTGTGRAMRHTSAGPTNIYAQFWHALVHLSHDPHPEVSRMGRIVLDFILSKITSAPSASKASSPVPALSKSDPKDHLSVEPQHSSNTVLDASPHSATSAAPSAQNQVSQTQPAELQSSDTHAHAQQSTSLTDTKHTAPPTDTIAIKNKPSSSASSTIDSATHSNVRLTPTATTGASSTSVARTSAFLIHSAHFPSRRHHMVDQLLREHVSNTSRDQAPPLTTTTPTGPVTPPVAVAPTESHPLDAVKTQLFAWSCRWFAQPLLAKYGGHSDPVEQQEQSNRSDSINDCESLVIPRRAPSLNPELTALGAVSVDAEAVAYADRLTRVQQQHEAVRHGRARWTEMIGSRDRPGVSAGGRTKLPSSDVLEEGTVATPMESGFLTHTATWHGANEPTLVRFHPHQPHMVVADQMGVTVCSLSGLEPLSRVDTPDDSNWFSRLTTGSSNPSAAVSRVTDIRFINPCEERDLLLTAHEDGRLRVWRNYIRDLGQDSEIVTAWTGLSDLLPSTHQAGLVVHWSQATTQLAVGGDARVVRLWDCESESKVRDIPTGVDACVTVLARSPDLRLLAAGFGDGTIKAFDLRMPQSSSLSHHTDSHIFSAQCDTGWVHDVQFGTSGRLYATGSTGGVAAWVWGAGTSAPAVRARRIDSKLGVQPATSTYAAPPPPSPSSTVAQRFRRLSHHPQRLAVPTHTPVHCAMLKVDLSNTTCHLLAAGIGGVTREVRLHRIHDGSVHSVLKLNSTPVAIALHPNKPFVAFGSKDKSVTLLSVEARRTSRA